MEWIMTFPWKSWEFHHPSQLLLTLHHFSEGWRVTNHQPGSFESQAGGIKNQQKTQLSTEIHLMEKGHGELADVFFFHHAAFFGNTDDPGIRFFLIRYDWSIGFFYIFWTMEEFINRSQVGQLELMLTQSYTIRTFKLVVLDLSHCPTLKLETRISKSLN